jgi:DNA invertase Pin-like site-specific DNA recombinase
MNRFALFIEKRANMKKAIAYYRVSTKRQQRSGLGIEAQQKAVQDFARIGHFKLIEEFIEMRSGMRSGNPGLSSALAECSKLDAVLMIAKLDRLKRNVAFIATLMESGVRFIAVDDPFAEEFTLHIKAAMGQREGREISKRTIAALAAAKRRGTELGKFGRYVLSVRNRMKAERFARKMRPVIKRLKKDGIYTLRDIRDALNRLKVPTFHQGGKWHLTTVFNLIKRISKTH